MFDGKTLGRARTALVTLFLLVIVGALILLGTNEPSTAIRDAAPSERTAQENASTNMTTPRATVPRTVMGVGVIETPPPTYAVGPTAQFMKLIPISEWLEYEDETVGFRVKYPPDWYLSSPPDDSRTHGYVTAFFSYDHHDPELPVLAKSGKWPGNFVKVEIYSVPEANDPPLRAGEDIAAWVRRTRPRADDDKLIQEGPVEIDGIAAFRQVIEYKGWSTGSATYFFYGGYVFTIAHRYYGPGTVVSQFLQTMIDSMEFGP
jgi:hypothetical protein